MMSNFSTQASVHRNLNPPLLLLVTVLIVFVSSNFAFASEGKNDNADDAPHANQVVGMQAASLEQMSSRLRDDIKNHLKSSSNYRELLSATNRVRVRSASVVRKVNRKSEYRGMQRDLDQLQEQMVELDAIGKEIQAKAVRKIGSEIPQTTISELEMKIQNMLSLADHLARGKAISEPVVEPIVGTISVYDPVIDVAPGFAPSNELPQLGVPEDLQLEGPTSQKVYSVLEKN